MGPRRDDTTGDLTDDDALLAALGRALATARPGDPELAQTQAREAFAFGVVADEFAGLVYDSALEAEEVGSRARGSIRTVVFESGDLTVEVELSEEAIVGQMAPPGRARVVAESVDGHRIEVETDELGCFTMGPAPNGILRFHVTTGEATTVTDWA